MLKPVAILLVFLAASSALAVVDPNPDSFGIYFNTSNNSNCMMTTQYYVPFPVYLVLMNPMAATNGFECTVTKVASAGHFVLSTTLNGVGALDVDASENGYMVGCAANYPVVSSGCTLVTWNFMVTSPGYIEVYIGPATIPSMSGGLPVVTGNGALRRCGVSSGDVTVRCGTVGEACPFPTETSAFGSVKSLFR